MVFISIKIEKKTISIFKNRKEKFVAKRDTFREKRRQAAIELALAEGKPVRPAAKDKKVANPSEKEDAGPGQAGKDKKKKKVVLAKVEKTA
jgi:hypothetical protein